MATQKSRSTRVKFDIGYPARIMAIDGTWFRNCHLEDVSQSGAKISVTGTVQGLNLTEFFLVLSRIGTAHRRCTMIWLKGEEMGLRFEISKAMDGRARRAMRSSEDHEE